MKQFNWKPWQALFALLLPSWLLAESQTHEEGVAIDVESVAQLAVSGDPLQWSIVAPTTPGAQPEVVQETVVQYLQYSSVMDAGGSPRRITIARSTTSGLLADGVVIHITPDTHVGQESGGGLGQVGSPGLLEAGILLGSGVLVDDIQTAWTGFGAGEGLRINYALELNVNTIYELEAGQHNNVELVFTMSESP